MSIIYTYYNDAHTHSLVLVFQCDFVKDKNATLMLVVVINLSWPFNFDQFFCYEEENLNGSGRW